MALFMNVSLCESLGHRISYNPYHGGSKESGRECEYTLIFCSTKSGNQNVIISTWIKHRYF